MKIIYFFKCIAHILCIFFTFYANADYQKTLLIISEKQNDNFSKHLKDSLQAQLTDLNISTQVRFHADKVSEYNFIDTAQKILNENKASILLWASEHNFFLIISNNSQFDLFKRELPPKKDELELRCDAIASSVRAIVTSQISQTPSQIVVTATKNPPSLDPQTIKKHWFLAGAGYNANLIAGFSQVTQGIGIFGGVEPFKNLTLRISSGFSALKQNDYILYKVPIYIGVLGFMPQIPFSVGASLEAGVEIVDVANKKTDSATLKVYPGFKASLVLKYKLHEKVNFIFEGGIVVLASSNKYLDANDESIFEYKPFGGNFLLGLFFRF